MKTLEFSYHLKIEFDSPVTGHSFTVRCLAETDARQRILKQDVHILPKEFLCENRDSFGNHYIFGKAQKPHTLFEVKTEGVVLTGCQTAVQADMPWRLGMFAGQTACTRPGKSLRSFYDSLTLPRGADNLKKGLYLMNALREHFTYAPGVTDISTTAQQAWDMGQGVCQDYSHILLSLCRMAGIHSRYVAGLLLGEGASHAWVEIEDKGMWYGLDPTNGVQVLEDHIKIAHGRDYNDCLLNQGVFTGQAKQLQSVIATVRDTAGQTAAGPAERRESE